MCSRQSNRSSPGCSPSSPTASRSPLPVNSRASYREAMLKYGSDKPDLRNPILVSDVSEHFKGSGFDLFDRIVGDGGVVRAIPAPGTAGKSRKFFDDMNDWARSEGPCRPRHHPGRRKRRPDSQEPWRGGDPQIGRGARPRPGRRHLLRRRQGRPGRETGRRRAHTRRRGAWPDPRRCLQILLDRRFSDVRI